MGNTYSSRIINENKDCLICWEQVDNNDCTQCVQCIQCNIQLHPYCEETYRGEKGYCKCPHCQGIGTLGIGRY
jgi:hypothetical protein